MRKQPIGAPASGVKPPPTLPPPPPKAWSHAQAVETMINAITAKLGDKTIEVFASWHTDGLRSIGFRRANKTGVRFTGETFDVAFAKANKWLDDERNGWRT